MITLYRLFITSVISEQDDNLEWFNEIKPKIHNVGFSIELFSMQ
jgi:hypothetical protein